MKVVNELVIFDAYDMYPSNWNEVFEYVVKLNKNSMIKYMYIDFNGDLYDVARCIKTGEKGKPDMKHNEYITVNEMPDLNMIFPRWDMTERKWVPTPTVSVGRGQSKPMIIIDLGDLVVSTLKKCVLVVMRDTSGNVLCVEHMKCKNKFSLPAGTIDDNESPFDTTVREMKEELNLDLNPDDIECVNVRVSEYDRIDGVHNYLEHVMVVNRRININDVTNNEPNKHPKLVWIDSQRFVGLNSGLFTKSTKQVLEEVVSWDIWMKK